MSAAAALRVGWCPGALRPMRVGDGLLVRIKPRGNRLTLGQAQGIAALSRRFGNGVLNLTGRGNVQLRGAAEAGLPPLLDALAALALLDASPEGEAVRNVQSSPLAGIDPAAVLDIRPLAAAWEEDLVGNAALRRLPAKFAWAIDDGGALGFADLAVDVRFTAIRRGRDILFSVALHGGAERALVAAGALRPAASALAKAFLALCAERALVPHRMRDLVSACGAAAIFARAELHLGRAGGIDETRVAIPAIGPTARGVWSVCGAAPPFGRLEAGALARFATAAGRLGAADLRLTPWRSLIAGGLGEAAAAALAESAAADLIVDPLDPRLAVAACAGEPACRRASTPVQRDAARLASMLPKGRRVATVLHVSGCAKGCAHAGAAPLTLVGHDGRYDLVRDGKAGDLPQERDVPWSGLVAAVAGPARAEETAW